MITCFIRYEIDPFNIAAFETYARSWGQAIPARNIRSGWPRSAERIFLRLVSAPHAERVEAGASCVQDGQKPRETP